MVIGKNIMQNKNLASNNEREIKSLKTDIHIYDSNIKRDSDDHNLYNLKGVRLEQCELKLN